MDNSQENLIKHVRVEHNDTKAVVKSYMFENPFTFRVSLLINGFLS